MNSIQICDMTTNHFEQIKDILISDFDDFWNPKLLKNEIVGENKKYIVALSNNIIVGFAGILILYPEIEIMNIVVKKNERNKGIGNLLLDKIIEIAQNNNYEKIFLEVNEKNNIAINMYKKHDFSNIGIRKKYYNYSDDAILMMKKIIH